MKGRWTSAATIALITMTTLTGAPARAADYPSKPMHLVVSLPPGSGADSTARFVGKYLNEQWGQAAIVENRTGANSFIAAQAVATAPADGYTMFVTSNSPMTTNAAVFKRLPYDPVADFTPVAGVMRIPMVMVVPASSPYRTIAELSEAARASKGTFSYGSGTATYEAVLASYKTLARFEAENVPYKGTSAAVLGVAGDQIVLTVADVTSVLPLIRAGKIRALAVTGAARQEDIPDVPTMIESGFKGFEFYAWTGIFMPARTDPAIVAKLEAAVLKLVRSPEGIDFIRKLGAEPFNADAKQLQKFQMDELAHMKDIVRTSNMPMQD